NYAAARRLWETFLNKYPLDARAPQILLAFGQMQYDAAVKLLPPTGGRPPAEGTRVDPAGARKPLEAAIEEWQRLVGKYPGTNEASRAALDIGLTLETRLARLADALEAYRKVVGPLQPEAQKRIANLTSKQLEIVTERKYRTQEKPQIKITAR